MYMCDNEVFDSLYVKSWAAKYVAKSTNKVTVNIIYGYLSARFNNTMLNMLYTCI